MIERVRAFSRPGIEAFQPEDGHCLVLSFRDPGSPIPRLPQGDLLCLEFSDISFAGIQALTPNPENGRLPEGVILFSAEMAERAAKFLAACARRHRFLAIHCEAGVSRSVSAARAVAETWRIAAELPHLEIPNRLVYERLKIALKAVRA